MQHEPAHASAAALIAIERIAGYRMSDTIEVRADLVPPPRLRPDLQERPRTQVIHHAEFRAAGPTAPGVNSNAP